LWDRPPGLSFAASVAFFSSLLKLMQGLIPRTVAIVNRAFRALPGTLCVESHAPKFMKFKKRLHK
jgi:hypothetical protein